MKKFFKQLSEFSTKKKIFIVSHDLSNTGAPRTLLGMVEILKELGFFVVVYSPYNGPLKEDFKKLDVWVWNAELKWFKFIIPFLKIFDLAICNTILSYKMVMAFEKMRIKYIWWIHEAATLQQFVDTEPKILKTLQQAKNIYTVSDFAKSYITKYNNDVKILKFGLKDISNKYENINNDSDKIIFCLPATIAYIKGHDVLLEAFSALSDEDKQKCEIRLMGPVGNEDLNKKITEYAETYKNIIYLGDLTSDETFKEIKRSHALVLPSRGDSFSTIVVEALMLDRTVICSNMAGVSSSITAGKNGFVFESENRQELTKCLKMVIDNPNLLEKGVAKSLFLEKFSFETYKTQVKQMLSDMNL